MMTRKLWCVLNDPPTLHPVFWRTIYRSGATQFATPDYKMEARLEKLFISYLLVLIVTWVFANALRGNVQILLLNFVFLLVAFPVLISSVIVLRFSLLNGTFNGLVWSLRISEAVARERECGSLELLWVSPPGALGAAMAVCTAFLYRKAALHQFRQQCRFILFAACGIGLLLVCNSGATLATPYTSYQMLMLVHVSVCVAAIYIDSVHSPIIGCLAAMLVPLYATNRVDTRLWTGGFYLTMQLFTVILALVMGIVIVPDIYHQLNLSGWVIDISPALITLLLLYVLRELIIRWLWYALAHYFNADPHEWSFWP